MTCRDEILAAFRRLATRTSRDTFSAAEIVKEVRSQESGYEESTILTHVTSRMWADAPNQHAVVGILADTFARLSDQAVPECVEWDCGPLGAEHLPGRDRAHHRDLRNDSARRSCSRTG